MNPARNERNSRGFTLLELLVVGAILGVLVVIELPAFAKANSRSQGVYCLNNQKQLILAAILYAQENHDTWVPNEPGQSRYWVGGNMSFMSTDTDNTNTAMLINPATSVMGPFVMDPRIFHCPADTSFVPGQGIRVRSVSMSQTVGTFGVSVGGVPAGTAVNGQWVLDQDIGTSLQTEWRTYGTTSAMHNPGAANLWVFADEHPDSINDGSLAVQMSKTGIFAALIDIPASYHDGGCGISFADGHAAIHKWVGTVIKAPIVNGGESIGNGGSGRYVGNNPNDIADVEWLQAHTSAHW